MTEALLRRLSDLAHVTMGQSPDASRIDRHGRGLPFLQGCAEFGAKHPSALAACHPPLRVAPTGSVLISVRAPVGTMNFADTSYCIGRGLGSFKAKDGLADTVFLKHAVELGAAWLHRRSQGSTFAAIAANDLRNVPVPDFPPETQQRIAAILTSLDNAIEATEALIEKHQQIRAGLMRDLFTRGVTPNGAIREPQVGSRADGAVGGAFPAGWDLLPLQRCLAEGASNGIYKPPHLIGSGALLVGQTAITEDRSVDPRLARRASVTAAELRRFGVADGDVLVARVFATVEGVGRPALVPDLGEPAVFESNMMRLRVAASVIRPRLLFEWLKSDASRRHIEGRANASNQVSVTQAVLYPLPVPIPPMDEQDRMVARIDAANRRREADLAVLGKLRMQKQGLMQDLLTGKVRVPSPAMESAT